MKRFGRTGLATAAIAVVMLAVGVAVALAAVPKATVVSPAGGATYSPGQVVAASFKCTKSTDCSDSNGTSGTHSATTKTFNLAGTLDTTSLGSHTYTVTAFDGVTTDTDHINYSVKADTALSDLTLIISGTHVATISVVLSRADNGNALDGRTIAFKTGSTALCTATTEDDTGTDADTDGLATCSFTVTKALQTSILKTITASFAGDNKFNATSLTVKAPTK